MSRFGRMTAIAGAAAAVIGAAAGPAAASTVTAGAPAVAWMPPPIVAAGYYAVPIPASTTTFTHIGDTFTIPQVTCTGSPAIAQQRAGLDGINDATVERVGISEICEPGTAKPFYSAWYQFYPAGGVAKFSPPHAGDTVDLSVTDDGGFFTLAVTDASSGQSFTVTKACDTCQATSAQVTAGPKTGTPLANFGSVDFRGIQVTDNGGVTGGLKNPAWDTGMLTDPGSPRAAAGPLHTFAGPPPHSEFVDTWVP